MADGPGTLARAVSLTGVTGFLGWSIAERFRDAGWDVTAIVRPGNRKPLPTGVRRVEAALDRESLARPASESSLIVHVAGLTHAPDEPAFNAVNVAGTEAVVRAANMTGARLILISSQAAVGAGTPQSPSREDDQPQPLTPYGRSKLAAEEVVRTFARTSWTILRPSAVYGPRDKQFLPLFRLASHGWFPLALNPQTAFTFIHVDDAARAVVRAATELTARAAAAEGTVLFLGHAEPRTAEDLLRALAQIYNQPYRPRRVPDGVLGALSWVSEWAWQIGKTPLLDRSRLIEFRAAGFVCAVDRAHDTLGFTAEVTLEDGLERTARWYREQRWI